MKQLQNSGTHTRRGFTLVEVVLTLAVLLIVGGIAGDAIYSAAVQYGNAMALNNAKAAVDNMQVLLAEKLRYAKGSVTVGAGPSGQCLYTEDGKLMYKETDSAAAVDFFAGTPDVYGGMEYTILFSGQDENSVKFSYTVARPDKPAHYTTETTLHFLNASVTVGSADALYLSWTS